MVGAACLHGFSECSVLFDQQSVDGNEFHRLNMLGHWQGVRLMKQISYLFCPKADFAAFKLRMGKFSQRRVGWESKKCIFKYAAAL